MKTVLSIPRSINISTPFTSQSGGAILPVYSPNPDWRGLNIDFYHGLIKTLDARCEVKSLPLSPFPTYPEIPTQQEKYTIARDSTWANARIHLDLLLKIGTADWEPLVTVSLQNQESLPYYKIPLLAYLTDGLAFAVAQDAQLGARIVDAGWGLLQSGDRVLIYGEVHEEASLITEVSTVIAPWPAPSPTPTPGPAPAPTPSPTPGPAPAPTPSPTPGPAPAPTPSPTPEPLQYFAVLSAYGGSQSPLSEFVEQVPDGFWLSRVRVVVEPQTAGSIIGAAFSVGTDDQPSLLAGGIDPNQAQDLRFEFSRAESPAVGTDILGTLVFSEITAELAGTIGVYLLFTPIELTTASPDPWGPLQYPPVTLPADPPYGSNDLLPLDQSISLWTPPRTVLQTSLYPGNRLVELYVDLRDSVITGDPEVFEGTIDCRVGTPDQPSLFLNWGDLRLVPGSLSEKKLNWLALTQTGVVWEFQLPNITDPTTSLKDLVFGTRYYPS